MRILLAASASYHPPKGGSTRSNLVWLRALAANGHECLVLSGGVEAGEAMVDGVRIQSIPNFGREASRISSAVTEFQPDFVLVSSEDLSHSILREAYQAARDRLVYLAHTPQWFPFGPEAWHRDEAATKLLGDALAIVSIGQHMAGYIQEHLGRKAEVVAPALYGQPPWPEYHNYEKQTVLLINPCTAKGLPIFLALAESFPDKRFLALKGWGTTSQDEQAMLAHANVEVLTTVAGIDEVLSRTSVLVAPSLWYEGFGLVVTEALLRGIPVLAGNHGGLTEAAAASRYRLPVQPIRRWLNQHDDTGMPVAEVEAQPIESWVAALKELLSDPHLYEQERSAGRQAATAFAQRLRADDLETLLLKLKARPLRIYLVHNSTYYPGAGGGDKSNRLLVEALVQQGHELRVFTRLESFGEQAHQAYETELNRRGIDHRDWKSIGKNFRLSGAEVHVISRECNLRKVLAEDLADQSPDIILCSTDDPAHLFYEVALQQPGARVIYLVRATIALPFGPDGSSDSAERTNRLREADAIVCVSEYVAQYCRNEGGLDAVHVPISLGDNPNPPLVGRFSNPYVTLVNPSAVKGLPILLGLADAMPDVQFAAVPSWGTTADDFAAIRLRKNITILDAVDDITEILTQTVVTLVPSLWAEARSRMVVESLSRGVPVMASAVGGLREAMCGVDHVLPVNPILHYQSKVSDQMVPEAQVPPQDLGPWIATLRHLLSSREAWEALSQRGREASLAYLGSLSAAPLESIMRKSLTRQIHRAAAGVRPLSPVKRKLLALRLAQFQKAQKRRNFPLRWGVGPRVFLFPWAAAGAQAWKFLGDQEGFEWIPALLPGREDRHEEQPARSFAEIIPAIVDEMAGMLQAEEKYYLAGHSMGGGLAFEVARELRRRALPLPAGLLLSSCNAPSRRKAQAAQSNPANVLEADQAMFGAHAYSRQEPLAIATTVISGSEENALEPKFWIEEFEARFQWVLAPGGHFWLKEHPDLFVAELRKLHLF
jgi:surfactin synthase thioesterase subunit/glycosyltransferase involved in cell wall biosynthesis